MTEPEARSRTPGYQTGRMEAFSDGVFAIAITLLILEISVPAGSDDDLLGALADQWPSYLAYFVSLGLFLPILAVLGYLALALFILGPFSALRHHPDPA